jgi:hypothetical protein
MCYTIKYLERIRDENGRKNHVSTDTIFHFNLNHFCICGKNENEMKIGWYVGGAETKTVCCFPSIFPKSHFY